METLDITKLKRDPNYIKSNLIMKDEFTLTKKDTYIVFPEKYEKKDLAELGNVCLVTGVFAIVMGDRYGVMTIPNHIEITPVEIEQVDINGDVYYRLFIEANTDIFSNNNIVKKSDRVYNLLDLFLMQGKVPWYIEYEDLVKVFTNVGKYTGLTATDKLLPVETIISIISKYKKDLTKDYRLVINKPQDLKTKPVEYVGLMDVYYTYKSTVSKLLGNFFKKAIDSTILYPEKEVTDIENVLRE